MAREDQSATLDERQRGGSQAERREPEEDATTGEADEQTGGFIAGLRRHKLATALTVVVLLIAAVAGLLWWLHARNYETTDDAFIDGRPVSVSPEVTGNIVAVPVTDNQVVRAGDLLARIDPRNYSAAVAQAQGQIEAAQASVLSARAQRDAQKDQIDQANNQIEEAAAALKFSQQQNSRAQNLVKTGAGTVQTAQQTESDLRSKTAANSAAIAALAAAKRQMSVIEAQIRSNEAQVDEAKAQLATAQANMSRTEIHATVDGRVTRLTAAVGAAATSGQALMIIVPNQLWVTANFKETALAYVRPGQPVDIEIDAYGRTFPGKVNTIQSGSGTAFSLLPAENATGNYVKVVQRIPVKIVFDKLPDVQLGPGMSVVPSVRVR